MGRQVSHDHTPALDSMQSLREETHPRLPCPPWSAGGASQRGFSRAHLLDFLQLPDHRHPQTPSPLPGGGPRGPHQFNAVEQIFYPHLLCVKDGSQPQVCTDGSGSGGEVHWDEEGEGMLLKLERGTQPSSGCSGPFPSHPNPQH